MTQDPRIWKSLAWAFSLSLCQEFFHQLYNIVLFKDNGGGRLGKMLIAKQPPILVHEFFDNLFQTITTRHHMLSRFSWTMKASHIKS
jgi:hypothetical protein